MIRSIESQITAMQSRWPTLRLAEQTDRAAYWHGSLRPLRKSYLIRVRYTQPLAPEMFTLVDVQPRVQVLNPVLERRPHFDDGPIPHVYTSELNPDLPYLCLFDPENRQWSTSDFIADTTIPWAARWLSCYEFWLATGEWSGGGRHPDESLNEGIDA